MNKLDVTFVVLTKDYRILELSLDLFVLGQVSTNFKLIG